MRHHLLLATASVAVLTMAVAVAEEARVEKKNDMTCTTTESANEKKVVCMSPAGQGAGPTWQNESGNHMMILPPGAHSQQDVDVQVLNDGDGKGERRVIIVRTRGGHDSADANKDGRVSRKEFLTRAEKHFAELDQDKNGVLEKDEMHPPMPPLPPMPPVPPVAPLPPVPPVPPAPGN